MMILARVHHILLFYLALTLAVHQTTVATVEPSQSTISSPVAHSHCASGFISCGSPSPAVSMIAGGLCCPIDAVCQIGAHGPRCVPAKEVSECEACCQHGRCTHITEGTGEEGKDQEGQMQLEFHTIQCCGVSAETSFCCPLRSKVDKDAPSKAQRCEAIQSAWDCVDAPSSILTMTASLAVWQLALCVVGGVLFCGALGGGSHRAYGGHCTNDCQALAACCAGCALFECCCAGNKGAGAPLLG